MSAVPVTAGWRADLQLRYEARGERTFLAHREHVGPLRVQRSFYPEPGRAQSGSCHTYIIHPPGGVVGGDELNVDVAVGEGANVLLTTPAATKYYRSDGRVARQTQRVRVFAAQFEWLPQEGIFHSGAHVRSITRFDLSRQSRFIGWEIPCLGLPARSEQFDAGRLELDLELWIDSQPVFIDRLRIDGELVARAARVDLAGHHAIGTMLAYPADHAMVDELRAVELEHVQLAATLVDGVMMCRALGSQAEHVKHAFVALWQRLRPRMLRREVTLPRIWST